MTGFVLALGLGLSTPAEAVDQLFRFGHEVYLDRTDDILEPLFDPNGDDFFKVNGTYRARRAFVELINASTGAVIDVQYIDDQGEAVFDIPAHPTLVSFRLGARHDIDGRSVYVFANESDPSPTYAEGPVFTAQDLPGSTTVPYDVIYPASVPGQEWINVAAIASWTIFRAPSAFPSWVDNGAVYNFAMDDPGAGNAGVYEQDTQFVLIWDDHDDGFWRFKHVIAHELGHALLHWATYPGTGLLFPDYAPETDHSLNDASCPSSGDHIFVSKEYQSAAMSEGMANFVSAGAFNKTTEGDCRIVPPVAFKWHIYAPSYSQLAYSCEGFVDGDAGVEYAFGVGGQDYMHETHSFGGNSVTCTDTGPTADVAVEVDWERFLWDLATKVPVTFKDIVDTFAASHPQGWESGTNAQWMFKTQLHITTGSSDAWDDHAIRNGVAQ